MGTSVHIDGVRQFDWSPTDNYVALWGPEHQNQPAKVVLMEMPSRAELRQKNLFNVADLHMHWHDEGHFLCDKDDKYKAQRQTRIDMRGGLESDNESAYTLVEDVDEVEISYKEDCVDVGGPRDSD